MKATIRPVGDVSVVELSGRLTLGHLLLLQSLKTEQVERGWRRILLHMGGVKEIDESGIRELQALVKSVEGEGVQLKLVHVDRVKGFTMTALAQFDCNYPDEAAAVRSFSTVRSATDSAQNPRRAHEGGLDCDIDGNF